MLNLFQLPLRGVYAILFSSLINQVKMERAALYVASHNISTR